MNRVAYRLVIFLMAFGLDPLEARIVSGVCPPYYASIKYSKANSHKGPGTQYKVACAYVYPGIPVVITAKYDNWRRIKDPDGDESWIHKSKLSSKRSVIVICENGVALMDGRGERASIIAHVKKNVVMSLLSVRGNWCKVEVQNGDNGKRYIGWVENGKVFGVYDNESL